MAKIISYTVFILLFVTGCSTDETEYFPEDNVLVEVKAPQTDGWSTKRLYQHPELLRENNRTERGRRTEYKKYIRFPIRRELQKAA